MEQEKRTIKDLQELQALPLSLKVKMTKRRIRDWIHKFGEDGVYISFSGGKDSTVLLHLVREDYPDVPAVFVDTGLEYPEIRSFVRTFDNVEWIRPKKNFRQVIEDYGYPFISKEVSECVSGARKYLTEILTENHDLADRQTDRQTDRQIPYRYWYDRVTGQGEYAKTNQGGGYDSRWRKLRGIGEFAKRQNDTQDGRQQSKACNNVRNADKGQGTFDTGEYP